MRRFSQRGHLVTLSEINVTPLLDLAFVLLIIFIITTPLLEQGVELRLPQGGQPDRPWTKDDFRTLEVSGRDAYLYQGRRVNFIQLAQLLTRERQLTPHVAILIRADRAAPYQVPFEVIDLCARLGLGVSLRAEPPQSP